MLSRLRAGKNLGFFLVVVGVLALGIGANTALFSIIDVVLLHPFPFRELDRMVDIGAVSDKGQSMGTTPLEMEFLASHARSIQQLSLWRWQNHVLTGVDEADSIFALEVSENLFGSLGVPAAVGRTLISGDFESSAPAVVVLSDKIWRKHFRSDPAVVGRQILLDGRGYTVVGVMGPEFVFTNPAHQVWVPFKKGMGVKEELSHGLNAMARLTPGVTMEQAQQEMNAISPSLPKASRRTDRSFIRLKPFTDQFTGEYRRSLMILWGAVGLVLLIACANAANLLLAHASERRREFAIRASLGANQFRLMRQVVMETLLLGVAAGGAGVALGLGFVRLIVKLFPDRLPLPRLDQVALNPTALAVTVGLVLLTTLLCAIPSCASLWRADLTVALGAASRSVSASRAANRARSAMLALEVALSILLLAGAGLMLRTLDRLMQVRLGFEPEHVLTAKVSIPPQVKTKPDQAAHYKRMLDEVRALPGVLDAGVTTVLPFGGLVATTSFTAEGHEKDPQPPHDGSRAVYFREVSPGYIAALGVRLLRGRDFTEADGPQAPAVVIVNDELARQYWPGEDAVGKHVSREDHPKPGEWSTVVGVVEGVKHHSLRAASDAELYFPYTQQLIGAKYTYLTVRVQGDPLSAAASLRRRIREVEPGQPVTEVKTMRAHVVDSAAEVRFHTLLLESFAGLALGLAIAGIFSVVSYTVAQRTREIGIREALGAGPVDVFRFVGGMAMRPVLIGSVIGIAGGLAATRVLEAELFQTAPMDPLVFSVVFVLLMLTAMGAAAVPAWRAMGIDPAEVLRSE
jgi:putative ABC transport system permease protein